MPASFSSPPQKDFIVFDCDGDWRKTPIGINRFKDGPTPFGAVAKGLVALGTPPPLSVPSGGRAVAMRWGVAIGAVHRAVRTFELSHTIPHFSGEGAVDEH